MLSSRLLAAEASAPAGLITTVEPRRRSAVAVWSAVPRGAACGADVGVDEGRPSAPTLNCTPRPH